MPQRERSNESPTPPTNPASPGGSAPYWRRLGDAYWAAAHNAVEGALSRDAEAFNRSNRQTGGQ